MKRHFTLDVFCCNLRCFVSKPVAIYVLSMWRQIKPKVMSAEKNYKYVVCLFAGGLAGGEADGASGGEGRTKASNPG